VHRQATTLGKLLRPMCLCQCHQAVQFGTGQRAVMLCGREGLANLPIKYLWSAAQTLVVYPPTGSRPKKGMSTPPIRAWSVLPLPYLATWGPVGAAGGQG